MIEYGTVVGNVSRTHHPCGACRELVETCGHFRPEPYLDRRRREAGERVAARMTVEDFAKQFRTRRPIS